jgi:hypothetical protein
MLDHARALQFRDEIVRKRKLVTSNYILDELYTLLLMNIGFQPTLIFVCVTQRTKEATSPNNPASRNLSHEIYISNSGAYFNGTRNKQQETRLPSFMEAKMAEIILKTDEPDKAVQVLREALETETLRLKYSLNLAKKRLKRFEVKYNISSEKFMNEWSAEDLKGKDLEYVEWAGEYQLFSRLSERLVVLKSIENVAS